ncbi:Chromobox protein 3 [Varicellaria rhodocarpa]|nr:Chromobox protein 3 [Varicellaria rhodocarpa]
MAERTADNTNNREILVRWTDLPDEKDWTWESETTLQEDVPNMMKAWDSRKTKEKEGTHTFASGDDVTEAQREEEVPIYQVEAILGKKKIKGLVHYLVRWKGYPLIKDRTWEVRERLRIDVPEMVDLFERRWRKRV